MPNRIIKESICTSENIDQLTAFEETVFIRLMVNADDFGRFDGRAKILSARLFPLKNVTPEEMTDALQSLVSADLVTVYEVDGKPYVHLNSWDKHQSTRASKSKYPSPSESTCKQLQANEIKCKQMNANVHVIQSNPIQSESISESESEYDNRNPSPRRKEPAKDDIDFEVFWQAYPRKESKPAAKKAFDKIHPDEELMQKIISSINSWKQSAQWQENGGQFIPYPASWLNQQKWNDQPSVSSSAPASASVQQRRVLPAQDFAQRDYSGVQDDMMANLAREMAAFKATGKVDM